MYEPIVGTLGYVLSPDRKETLLVFRNRRSHDHHLGKYNGLGGKLRPDEDVMSCLHREIREEAGIECEEVELRGTINWTGFGPEGENWLGFIFLVTRFSGSPYSENEEGELGKHPGQDMITGDVTLPLLALSDSVGPAEREEIKNMLGSAKGKGNLGKLRAMLLDSDALSKTLDVVGSYLAGARERLDTLADSVYKESLVQLVGQIAQSPRRDRTR